MENLIKNKIKTVDRLIKSSEDDLLKSNTDFTEGIAKGMIIAYTAMKEQLEDLLRRGVGVD